MGQDVIEPKVIFILGPTASGKTALSVQLAKLMNGEVINADALQFYRDFDIGTAKISQAEMEGVVHHGFDLIGDSREFSVRDFVQFAVPVIDDILSRGKSAIVVGGSNMYVQALLWTSELDGEATPPLDQPVTWGTLNDISPDAAASIHCNDLRRIENAVRKFKASTRIPLFRFPPTLSRVIIIDPLQSGVSEILNQRVDEMLTAGLKAEAVKALGIFLPGKGVMQGIGYKEWFKGAMMEDDAVAIDSIKSNTIRYHKQQIKWLKSLENRLPFEAIHIGLRDAVLLNRDATVLSIAKSLILPLLLPVPTPHIPSLKITRNFSCSVCGLTTLTERDHANHVRSKKHKAVIKRLK